MSPTATAMQGFGRRPRHFVAWAARLVLFALVFQTLAVDHWHPDPAHAVGIEGTAFHAMHCHGESGCSSGMAAATALPDAGWSPLAPLTVRHYAAPELRANTAAFVFLPDEPPRAA